MKKQQLRIIGGHWRSRRIHFLDGPGLRPTGDRNRETLFNWLSPYLHQAHCLDLFGGSGILSFEALSRGAASSLIFEKSKRVAQQIKESATQLNTKSIQVRNQDALLWLKKIGQTLPRSEAEPPRYDICFIDPPFNKGLVTTVIESIQQAGVLADDALIYLEHEQALTTQIPPHWELYKEKHAGQVVYKLFHTTADLQQHH